MKTTMNRANMVEDRKNIIVMFLNELNRDIINVIELQHRKLSDDFYFFIILVISRALFGLVF